MERKSNIELLRIVAMFMIVGSHLACHGVQSQLLGNNAYQIWNDGSEINKIFVSFLNPGGGGGGGGVALFFIITGYFQVKKEKVTVKKVALETILYGWSISLLWIVATIMGLTRKAETHVSLLVLLKQFFNPLLSGAWWFVTVYIIVLFNSPLINKIIKNKSKRSFSVALILMWMIGYTLPCFEEAAYFEIYRGVFFYCVGAYIKQSGKCDIKVDKRAPYIFAFIVAWIMGTVLYHIYGYTCLLTESKTAIFVGKICMTGFHATVVPICSISLFTLFARMKTAVNHMINGMANTVFASYLISDSGLVRDYLWHDLLHIDNFWYQKSFFPLFAIGCVALTMLVCTLIDLLRIKWIEPIYLNQLSKVENLKMRFDGQ